MRPATEEMLMIIPDCCARMIGITARIVLAAASTFSRNSASTSAASASAMLALRPTPALFTSTSMPPSPRIVSVVIRSTWSGMVTSVRITTASPPRSRISLASSSSAGRLRAARATRAPRPLNSSAIARPMPCEAPVITTRALFRCMRYCWQPRQKSVASPRAVSSEIRWPQRGHFSFALPWTAMKLRSCLCAS